MKMITAAKIFQQNINTKYRLKWMMIRLILGMLLVLPIIFTGIAIGDYLFVIICYGSDAYADGLRVLDSKHGILNTGEEIRGIHEVLRTLLIYFSLLPMMIVNIWFMLGRGPLSSEEDRLDRKWDEAVERVILSKGTYSLGRRNK